MPNSLKHKKVNIKRGGVIPRKTVVKSRAQNKSRSQRSRKNYT